MSSISIKCTSKDQSRGFAISIGTAWVVIYEIIGTKSSQDFHCISTLHSTGLPHSTNGLDLSVKLSPRVWIGIMLISSVATFFVLCFSSEPSVCTIPYACNSLTTSISELVASTMGFEVSDISASYAACLDPWPLLLLLPLPLPCHDPLVFLFKLGVLVVDQHSFEKWPCLLHLKQTDDAAGHSPT